MSIKTHILLLIGLLAGLSSFGQSTCDSLVPSFEVDLSMDADGVFISEDIRREALCCDNYWPDRCVEFIITLHPSAIGIIFDIERGAEPPGALFYRIGCGDEIPVGELACIDGAGPHYLTFCKPGANRNIYSITSIPARIAADTATVVEGCSVDVGVEGMVDSTIIWTDISSGTGEYNSLLSCTAGCDSATFFSTLGLPDTIQYQVCGTMKNPICNTDTTACDTITIYILEDLHVEIQPGSDTICTNNPSMELKAMITGGHDSLVIEWYHSNTSNYIGGDTSITVTVSGTYGVVVYDAMNPICRRDSAEVNIQFAPLPSLNIPPDTSTCVNTELYLTASGSPHINWFTDTEMLCEDCPSITYTPTTDETIYVEGISAFGCTVLDSFHITILPVYVTTISDTLCSGQSYILPSGSTTVNAGTYTNVLTSSIGCDSVVHTLLTVMPSYLETQTVNICDGESYTLPGGGEVTTTGDYADYFQTAYGCDSIIFTLLTVLPSPYTTIQSSICETETYTLPGGSVVNTSGTYIDSFQTVFGCDSIIETELMVAATFDIHINDTICDGTLYTLPNGVTTTSTGIYPISYQTSSGCDSLVTVHLTVMPSYFIQWRPFICNGESHILPNGTTSGVSGTYTDTFRTAYGCDSIIETTLTVMPVYEMQTDAAICEGESYTLPGGSAVNTEGTYIDSFLTFQGCDSVITTILEVHPVYDTTHYVSICFGEDHVLSDGNTVNDPGSYSVLHTTSAGCDSLITTILDVLPTYEFYIWDTICGIDTYILPGGDTVNASGTYVDGYTTQAGCDSVYTTYLTVMPTAVVSIVDTLCAGESYTFPWGTEVSEAGDFIDTLYTGYGCDSIINIQLVVMPVYDTVIDQIICDGETYTLPDGSTVLVSGDWTHIFNSEYGCDSVITTHLTVLPSWQFNISDTICEREIYLLPDGNEVDSAGTYTVSISTLTACDSSFTIELVSVPSIVVTVYDTICEGESYIFPGGVTATQPGMSVDTFFTGFGCDSVIQTVLTVLPSYNLSNSETICSGESFLLPDGTLVTNAGTYVNSFTTLAGCDSIITIELNVVPVFNAVVSETICNVDQYTLPGGTIVNTSGTYIDSFLNINGCDSVITTQLTVMPAVITMVYDTKCSGENYILPNGDTIVSGALFSDTLYTGFGCDSVIHITLTVLPAYHTFITDTICEGNSYSLPDGSTTLTGGTFEYQFSTTEGCDSLVNIDLWVAPRYDTTIYLTLCEGETYLLPDGNTVSSNGTYGTSFISLYGCDSTITTELLFRPHVELHDTVALCEGEFHTLPDGSLVSSSGHYINSFQTIIGCDSILHTHLTILPVYDTTLTISICQGDTYALPDGSTTSTAGIYTTTLTSAHGCDSIITVDLSVLPTYNSEQNAVICAGEFYVLPDGAVADSSGIYTSSFQTFTGCDSVITIDLDVLEHHAIDQYVAVCEGSSYILPNGVETSDAGIFIDSLTSSTGCDSVLTITVEIVPNFDIMTAAGICEGETYILPHGQPADSQGTYTDSFLTADGCDFIITTVLEVYPVYEIEQSATICEGDNFILPGGDTVSTTGTYTDIFQSISGCDSVVLTNINLLPSYHIIYRDTICEGEPYTLPEGETVYVAGSYSAQYTTYQGCDSTITNHLTVMPSWNISQQAGICPGASYTLPGGEKVDAGIYVDTFTTTYGCDSFITTAVYELPVYDILFSYTVCEGDTVMLPDGSTFWDDTVMTNLYTSSVGCDSLVTCEVILIPITTSFVETTICEGDSLMVGDQAYYEEETFLATLISIDGCDSIVMVELAVQHPFEATIDTSMCPGDVVELAGETFDQQGEYVVYYEDIFGCDSIYYVNIIYHDVPFVVARGDTTILQGGEVEAYTLFHSEDRPLEIKWYVGDSMAYRNVERFNGQYFRSTEIKVQIIDTNFCQAADAFRIEIEETCPDDLIFAPNIITPNFDGANDEFEILNPSRVAISEVAIFNRWGELVHHATDFMDPWDGTFRGMQCNPGVYTYYIKGTCESGDALLKKGNITLIR